MPTKSWIEVPIEQEIESVPAEGYAPFFFPPEGADLLFHFTEQSFLRVLSALINGAALTYPDTWLQVVWDFLQNVEYPVSFCEQLIACITTDADTQEAIVNMLAANPAFDEFLKNTVRGLTSGQTGQKLTVDECDNSVLMGKVKAMVDAMNTTNTDFFEIVEVGTNDEEKMSILLDAIPGLGILPFDEVVDFLQDITEDFSENYAAQVTEALKLEWYCGLYCLASARPDCSLTYADIFNYFQDKVSSSLTLGSLIGEVIQFIVTGDFSGADRVANGMMALQAGLMRTGGDFLGLSLPSLSITARESDPSSLWEDCEDCPDEEWEKVWDFHDSDGGWTLVRGVYQATVGYHQVGSGTNPYTVDLTRAVTWGTAELTEVEIDVASENADAGAFRGVYYPGTAFAPQAGYTSSTGGYTMAFTANNPQPPTVAVQVSNEFISGYNYMFKVTLRGTGPEPTW